MKHDNSKREIKDKRLFEAISMKYAEKDVYPLSRKARKFQMQSLLKLVFKTYGEKEFNQVLEIGCGHGANSQYIKGYYKTYLGVDYSKELIKIAESRYASLNTRFICQNIKELNDFENFDFIFGVGILHHATELDKVLKTLKNISHKNTIFAFAEIQSGNPFIQLLRKIRSTVDKSYSFDQHSFSRNELKSIFEANGYMVGNIAYEGYVSPPFAQIILKPLFIFKPLLSLALFIDRYLQNRIDSRLAWNILLVATSNA
jgi:cyclopropane fatty-acyl-phospholipid synthase-like methyltransferase